MRSVVVVRGDHGLKSDLPGIADAVASWLMVIVARLHLAASTVHAFELIDDGVELRLRRARLAVLALAQRAS